MQAQLIMNYPSVLKAVRTFNWEDKIKLFNELEREIQVKDRVIQRKIYFLHHHQLANPLEISVEPDENMYLAKSLDFPLYANGETIEKASKNLSMAIEELYLELRDGTDFSDEWLNYKNMLNKAIFNDEKQSI